MLLPLGLLLIRLKERKMSWVVDGNLKVPCELKCAVSKADRPIRINLHDHWSEYLIK